MRRTITMLLLGGFLVAGSLPAAAGLPAREDVRTFPGPGVAVPGANAKLVRQPDGASFTFTTNGLTAGNAYTIWFVAFSNPAACTAPMVDGDEVIALCGLPDLRNPAAQPTAVWGAGHVVGESGTASLGGRVAEGNTSGCDGLGRLPCGDGLTYPQGAEIHLVARSHGPMIPELVNEQIHSFNRGCEVGEPNVGLCSNVQFAAFLP